MSATEDQKLVIERCQSPQRSTEEMPVVQQGIERSLRAFLEKASLAVHDWHSIPDYSLAFRFLVSNHPEKALAFEICKINSNLPDSRFYYDSSSHTIVLPSNKPIEHPELTTHRGLPDNPSDLSRVIAALVHDDPTLLQTIETNFSFGQFHRVLQEPSDRVKIPHSPANHAFSDILRHLTSHWFGGRQVVWRWPLRFGFALFGSATLTLTQGIVYSARFPEWFSQNLGIVPRQSDFEQFAGTEFQVGALILLSVCFASLTSLVDQQHGPVRLFLGGFLVPYFVLSLLQWLSL